MIRRRAVVYTRRRRRSLKREPFALGESSPVTMPSQQDVTRLLVRLTDGDRGVLDDLLPVVYGELRRLAASYLRKERVGHTLQPTALVHEAYMRLVDQTQVQWQNRAHFFGGLSVEETAEVLGVSAPTVKRQWRMAKAWLYGQVKPS